MIIRPLTPDHGWDSYQDLTMRSFGPLDEARLRTTIEPAMVAGRCLGAFDGGQLVGSALYHDLRQWWHGRPVRMAGVAGVQVAPEYRGQGVGRALMTAIAQLMTERGYPLSALYPATMTIYRSLGWEIAGHLHEAVLPARALSWLARSLEIPNGARCLFRRPCVARRADAPGAGRPWPGRSVRGHAGRDPAPGRPGRGRQPGRRRCPGRRVRRDPVHAGRLLGCVSRGDDPKTPPILAGPIPPDPPWGG